MHTILDRETNVLRWNEQDIALDRENPVDEMIYGAAWEFDMATEAIHTAAMSLSRTAARIAEATAAGVSAGGAPRTDDLVGAQARQTAARDGIARLVWLRGKVA